MKIRYFISFNMKNIYEFMKQNKINTEKEITLEDCFDYYYKTEGMIYKSPEIMLISFIIEYNQSCQGKSRHGHIDIRQIKHRKINRFKINKIHHIVPKTAVDHISHRPGYNEITTQSQREKMLCPRNPVQDPQD